MQGNYHLLAVLAFFAFSALSWVIGKLREQAAIKKSRDEARRNRDEELRTGRAVEAPAQTRGGELAELRELAAKRQQQLQQMRDMQKRSAAAAKQRPKDTVVFGPSPIPLPGGQRQQGPGVPGVPGRPSLPNAPVTLRPQGRPQQQPSRGVQDIRPGTPLPRAKGKTPATRREEPAAEFVRQPYTVEPAKPRRIVADTTDHIGGPGAPETSVNRPAPVGLAALLATAGKRPTPSDMRRAIMLNEVLSKPVGMRDPIGG